MDIVCKPVIKFLIQRIENLIILQGKWLLIICCGMLKWDDFWIIAADHALDVFNLLGTVLPSITLMEVYFWDEIKILVEILEKEML